MEGLKCRGGRWTLRVRVPDQLRAIVGKREVWKSFGAVSYAEACKAARLERVKIDKLFDEARTKPNGQPIDNLSDGELVDLSRAFLQRVESDAEPVPFDALERQEIAEANREDLMRLSQGHEDATVQLVAQDFARWARLNIEPRTFAFLRLTQAVHRVLVEHHLRQTDRLSLKPPRAHDPLFVGSDAASSTTPPLTLERAVELYKAAPERAGNAPKTRAADDFRFAVIVELLGAKKLVADISRADVREARNVLLRLPPNAAKRFRGTPLRSVAEVAANKRLVPMSAKSATLYIECLSALFRWMVQEELAPRNPAQGLKGPPVPKSTRRPFTVAEANSLFRASPFDGSQGLDWLFWFPRVAIFTGMRLGEIAGLKATDLVTRDDILCFSVQDNEHRKLKTPQSARIIPVHSQLREIGLVEHANSLPSDGLLFPGQPSDGGRGSNATQKKIGRLIRTACPDRSLVFHSFRHTFKDAMLEAGLPRNVAEAIGGWRDGGGSSMDGYGRGYRERTLSEWIEKIEYDGLANFG